MFKFAFTVRAYNTCRRFYFIPNCAEECILIGDLELMENPRASARFITEMYRAGGMGVYQIKERIGKNSIEEIRDYCEYLDNLLHQSMN